MILAGVDLAWRSKNPSALAFGELEGHSLAVTSVIADLPSPEAVLDALISKQQLVGIAIDAPLIIENHSGQRPCERAISSEYGSRHASCHTSNTRLYPAAASVSLALALAEKGFEHMFGAKWQIECYPHPAIIEIFNLSERLKYKKGNVAAKRAGQQALAALILSLENNEILSLHFDDTSRRVMQSSYMDSLRGQALKSNEDALDAIICLYIAGLYAIQAPGKMFGTREDGYIWVPGSIAGEN